ncbi:T9SS type A sorting domain-containing protein [bacterium]|nr:T9SS type A sorting domain-containing protein [bacterium]
MKKVKIYILPVVILGIARFVFAQDIIFVNGANAALNFQQSSPSPPESNWPFGQFTLRSAPVPSPLSSVTVTLGGTYDPGDLQSTPFQLYASNTNDFSSASALGSSVADPGSGNDVTFTVNDIIPRGNRHYWVTADISASAAVDDNINGTVSDAGDLNVAGTMSGASSYGKLNAGTDVSLPVGLVSFSARAEARSIVLNWITESETDNLGFILERSEEDIWTEIASYKSNDVLKGQGNTSSQTEYSFTDKTVESGKKYTYRLSDVSTKGGITVYSPLSITMDNLPEATEMKKAYPNPFNPKTFISYQLSKDTRVEISVFDLLGRRLRTLHDGPQFAGSYQVYWSGTNENGINVPSGAYIIRMQTDRITQVQKVLFMK